MRVLSARVWYGTYSSSDDKYQTFQMTKLPNNKVVKAALRMVWFCPEIYTRYLVYKNRKSCLYCRTKWWLFASATAVWDLEIMKETRRPILAWWQGERKFYHVYLVSQVLCLREILPVSACMSPIDGPVQVVVEVAHVFMHLTMSACTWIASWSILKIFCSSCMRVHHTHLVWVDGPASRFRLAM